jgi:hypothetical protein
MEVCVIGDYDDIMSSAQNSIFFYCLCVTVKLRQFQIIDEILNNHVSYVLQSRGLAETEWTECMHLIMYIYI